MVEVWRGLISERTSAALQHKKAKGERVGPPALGVRVVDGQDVADPAEIETLRYILELKAQGFGLRAIADRLNNEERATKRGGRWHASTVRYIIDHASLPEAV